MMADHPDMTEVPWRVSASPYGAVVCDVPCRAKDQNDSHYGGYLVCESLSGPKVKRLVAAAPEMRDLLRRIAATRTFAEETILGRAIIQLLDRIETGHEHSNRTTTSNINGESLGGINGSA